MANVSSVESIKHWGTLQITYTVDDDFYYNNIDFDGDSEVDLIHELQGVLTGTPDVTDGNSGFASYAINQFNLVSALQITPESGNPEDADIGFFKANRIQPSGERKLGVTQPFFDAVSSDDFEYAGIAVSKNVTFAANEEQFTYLHELGHAVGLEHPNAGDGSDINFNQTMTVMSSRTADMAIGVAAFAGIKYATSFMSFDIAALQDKYGKPVSDSNPDSYNSIFDGSTTVQTIWDNGGTDEIDLSGQNDRVTIDLREAVDSSGDFHDYKTIVGNQWTYVARGADIENAKGGSDNDIIHGNDNRTLFTSGNASYAAFNGNNILEGNGGNDQIYGHGGNDILIGGDDDDLLVGGAGADTYVIDIADTGTDTIDDDTGSLEIDGTYVGDFFGLALEGTLDSGIAIEDPDIDNIWTLGDYTLSLNNNGQDLLIDGPLQDILLKNFQDGDYGIYLGTENLDEEDIAVDETYNDAPVRYVSYYFPASGLYEVQLETLSPPANSVYQGYALDAENASEVLAENVSGTSGNDNYTNTTYFSAPRGNTTLTFGAGNDIINSNYGRHYNQTVNAGDDRDFITTNGGAGTVNGDAGDDEFTLNPYYGLSTLTVVSGGDGRDTFNGLGAASINGGNGTDTWNVSTNGAGYTGHAVELDVSAGSLVIDGTLGDISFSNIERFNIFTSSADDSLLLGAGNDTIQAGTGENTIDAGAGDDSIYYTGTDSIHGGDGDDLIGMNLSLAGSSTVYGDDGNDTILAGAYNDSLFGGDGNDSILGASGDDTISGEANDDYIYDIEGSNSIDGGAGNDTIIGSGVINGGDGNDGLQADSSSSSAVTIDGGIGNDIINGALGYDSLIGGDGNDYVDGHEGNNTISGGDGNDTIQSYGGTDSLIGGNGLDYMFGFAGNDTIDGGQDSDTIYGGAGADSILGGMASDMLLGEADNDYIDGGDGDDAITGGAGADSIIGGNGTDTIYYTGSTSAVTVLLNTASNTGGTQRAIVFQDWKTSRAQTLMTA